MGLVSGEKVIQIYAKEVAADLGSKTSVRLIGGVTGLNEISSKFRTMIDYSVGTLGGSFLACKVSVQKKDCCKTSSQLILMHFCAFSVYARTATLRCRTDPQV